MSFSLENYTPVNDRTLMFYKQYPAGVITTQPAKIVTIGDRTFISVIARVYLDRFMEDAPITEAEAWEPFPGTTPYTRDSEQMNAATSAVGRALGQLGIGIEKGMASSDEVKTAQSRGNEPVVQAIARKAIRDGGLGKAATDKQLDAVVRICEKAQVYGPDAQATALSQLLGRVINNLRTDLGFADIDPIFNAGPDGIKAAYKATEGATIITRTAPPADEDPWAGETLA